VPATVTDGMRRIRAEHPDHPYAAQWWPIGRGVGYGSSFANQVADLLEGWPDAPWTPDFQVGAAVQAVCDAMEISAASRRWVKISEITSDVQKSGEGDLWPDG
jgi:predicted dehydrogenase